MLRPPENVSDRPAPDNSLPTALARWFSGKVTRSSEAGTLNGDAHAAPDGRVDGLILGIEEAAWLQACWRAAAT
jgi:hypothetical protein